MKKNKKTINTIKLVVVLLMAAAIAFSALAPIFGAEDDLVAEQNTPPTKEEINSFVEEVRQLVKDFAETPKTITVVKPVRGVPSGFVFNNQLRERATGTAISYLQMVLNADPDTRVADLGAGSPGKETNYFGPVTRRALIKFQQKYNLSATGIVDIATRAKINEVLQKGITVKEEATEQMNELRARLMNMAQTMMQLRERIRATQEQTEE